MLLRHEDGRVKNINPSCFMPTVKIGGNGLIVRGMFSWQRLYLNINLNIYLDATTYLSIVVDHVLPFMASLPFFKWLLPAGNVPQGHKVHLISSWFHEHCTDFSSQQWPAQTPDLNLI